MKKMSKIESLSVALDALNELARCGNDECAEAMYYIDKILSQTIRHNVKCRMNKKKKG